MTTLPETSPAMTEADRLSASVELWGAEYEAAGRLDVAPGTATTDEPTDVAEVAGRWARTLAAAVGDDEASALVAAMLEWLTARWHLGRALAAADEPGAVADAFNLGRAVGVAEEHARHLRQAWALPMLQVWADEAAAQAEQ